MSPRDVRLLLIGGLAGGSFVAMAMLLGILAMSDISVSASWEDSPPPPPMAVQNPSEDTSGWVLDGRCPVTLVDEFRWVKGDRRYQHNVGEMVFLFVGPSERDRFLLHPERYTPVLAGHDVVLAKEKGGQVLGKREHGIPQTRFGYS